VPNKQRSRLPWAYGTTSIVKRRCAWIGRAHQRCGLVLEFARRRSKKEFQNFEKTLGAVIDVWFCATHLSRKLARR